MFLIDKENFPTEKQIQALFQTHPYLIESKFLNQKVIPQYHLISGFADIIVFMEKEIVVIELKVDPLNQNHLLQLKGYIDDIKQEFRNVKHFRGILIGKQPDDDLNLLIDDFSFEIRLMILHKDIPTKAKICNSCRLANDIKNQNCIFCNSKKILE